MSATLEAIRAKMKDGHYEPNTEELVEVPVELYSMEIVHAAAKALGEKQLPESYIEMYEFCYLNQQKGIGVKPKQADGVLRSHSKISKWLKKQNINDIGNLNDPDLMRIYLSEHIASMEAALKVFKDVARALGGLEPV